MSDLKSQVRELATAIESKKNEAAQAWASFDGLRKAATSEGVDFVNDKEAFEKIDAASKNYDTIRDDVAGMESKRARLLEIVGEAGHDMASKGDIEGALAKTFGASFIKSDGYRAMKARLVSSDKIPVGTTESIKAMNREEFKTLVSITAGNVPAPLADRLGLIVAKPLAGLDFLSVIATATTDSDVVEWLEETTYTNAAAEVAEGTASAESAVSFTKRSANVEEVSHFIPMTRRAMADAAYVESWVNNRLIDGVRRRLQTQVLSGDGTGDNLAGLYGNAGIGSIDRSVLVVDMLESLHKCITNIRVNAFQEPDFIGIHPNDYETIRLIKASTAGTYQFGDPAAQGPATAWGVPLIVHAAFTAGTPLVGVGREATLWIREGVAVSASDSHSDFFTKRQVALLATTRVAFGVTQPKAFAVSVA